MKSTGVAQRADLWETVGVAKQYVPKVGDPVFLAGKAFVRYVVTQVDETKKTADVRTTSGVVLLYRDVAWPNIYELDESQNAARIVREATEGR